MLTDIEKSTLKTYIEADATLNAYPHTSDGAFAIAALLNEEAAPAYVVWRTDVSTSECKAAMVWTEYIGRSDAERQSWVFMLSDGFIDASDVNVQQGIQDIFSGPQGAATRAAMIEAAKRNATVVEQVFAAGSGTDGSPSTMGREGSVNYQDVLAARNHEG
jgi:hypothetical protein